MKINFSDPLATGQRHQSSVESTTVVKLAGFVVTGMLCIFAAIMTTVVESGGWRSFWLGICICLFVSAFSFVIWATKDGLRIDHAGLRFEPPKTEPSEHETGIGDNR